MMKVTRPPKNVIVRCSENFTFSLLYASMQLNSGSLSRSYYLKSRVKSIYFLDSFSDNVIDGSVVFGGS